MTEGQTQGEGWGDIEGGIDWPGRAKKVEISKDASVEPEVIDDTEDLELTWDHTRGKETPQDMSPAEAAIRDAEIKRLYNEKHSGELPN